MKKGFTLIELLAVIVILAIIALISVPMVLNAVDKASKASYVESLRGILEATDIYVASDDFTSIPDEGLDVTDENIKMKNKSFTSGKVFVNDNGELELEKVSDGSYCGGGTLKNMIVIESSCENLDITGPTLSVATNSLTSSSVTVVATANDPESDISGYQFSKDNGETWTDKQASNVYDFTGLTNGQTYQIKVKVYNDNVSLVLSTTKLVEITTVDIPEPTYSVDTTDWSQSKTVTITYPERHEGYVYEYSLDNASTWTEVPDPDLTKEITFDANGSVIARISDGTNEINGTTYEVTKIDTTAPVITVNPAVVTTYKGFTYTDSGITANDEPMGDITVDIVTTGSVDTSTEGTYTLSYNVTDAAGNAAIEVIRQVNVAASVYTFSYTGSSQTLSVPIDGTYKLEVWGAQGGNAYYSSSYYGYGGKGGYSKGEINLSKGETIYIYVGGQGSNMYNSCGTSSGGYNGGGQGNCYAGGGGGGTDIRRNSTSLNNRIIVAGGGGGGSTYSSYRVNGGYGGGLNGGYGYSNGNWSSGYTCYGGTQSSGGTNTSGWNGAGSLGQGGSYYSSYIGGGGGGYYGGAAGAYHGYGGAGGSSYIGSLANSQTLSGNQSMPNPSGGTMTGRSGHGYGKITLISY